LIGKKCKADAREFRQLASIDEARALEVQNAKSDLFQALWKTDMDFHVLEDERAKERSLESLVSKVKEFKKRIPDEMVESSRRHEPMLKVMHMMSFMYDRIGKPVQALKLSLRSLVLSPCRVGPEFVQRLCSVASYMNDVASMDDDDIAFVTLPTGVALPSPSEMRVLLIGYLEVLCLGAATTYGADARFTMATVRWRKEMAVHPLLPVFAPGFRTRQRKLLDWAGVKDDCGLVLPESEHDLEVVNKVMREFVDHQNQLQASLRRDMWDAIAELKYLASLTKFAALSSPEQAYWASMLRAAVDEFQQ